REQACRLVGIANGRIEIDHAVVHPARTDPLIDRLTLGFVLRPGALERRERGSIDNDAAFVSPLDDLTKAIDDIVGGNGIDGVSANVLELLEDAYMGEARLHQDVAIEAREETGAGAGVEHAIARDSGVHDGL